MLAAGKMIVWKNCYRPNLRGFNGFLLAGCVLLAGAGCSRAHTTPRLETAYVKGVAVPLRAQLGPTSGTVATLKGGERVEVVAKRARWVEVRVEGGRTGWLHSRFLASPELFSQFQRLAAETASLPSEGQARIRREASLHLEADNHSDVFYSLPERVAVEVLAHRVAERIDSPTNSDKVAEQETNKPEDQATEVEVRRNEDWLLARDSTGKTGWLRESLIDMSPPIEIARYNEGLRIRAWFVIYREQHGDEVHPWYLWATIRPHPGLPYDYDEIRVFVWNPQKSRYETSYRERKLIGYYPVETGSRQTRSGPSPTFSLQLEDQSGKRFRKAYIMEGRLVKSGN